MQEFESGYNAVKNVQLSEINRQYEKPLADIKFQQEKSDMELKQFNVQKLQETMQEDKELASASEQYFKNNPDKPLSEGYQHLANLTKGTDGKKSLAFQQKAASLMEQESKAVKLNEEKQQIAIDKTQRMLQYADPNDFKQMSNIIMSAKVDGLNPQPMEADIRSGLYTPTEIRDRAVARLNSVKEVAAEKKLAFEEKKLKQSADKAVADQEIANRRVDAILAGVSAQGNRAAVIEKKMDLEEFKVTQKGVKDVEDFRNKNTDDYRNTFNKIEEERTKGADLPEEIADQNRRKQEASETYIANIVRYNSSAQDAYDKAGIPFKPIPVPKMNKEEKKIEKGWFSDSETLLPMGKVKEGSSTTPDPETPNKVDIKVSNGFKPSADQEQSIANAVRAIEKNPAIKDKVLARLRSAGIKVE